MIQNLLLNGFWVVSIQAVFSLLFCIYIWYTVPIIANLSDESYVKYPERLNKPKRTRITIGVIFPILCIVMAYSPILIFSEPVILEFMVPGVMSIIYLILSRYLIRFGYLI